MLHITGSVITLRKELSSAESVCIGIISTLQAVKPETNLTKNVGIFAVQMPDYKVLARDADSAKKLLRMVCTGEMSPQDACQKFRKALDEVQTLLEKLSI